MEPPAASNERRKLAPRKPRRQERPRPPARTNGGEGGIRTHGPVARSTVFETAPFDRSGTSPVAFLQIDGGESGIRTHGRVSPTHAFQACSLSHSDISPEPIQRTFAASIRDAATRKNRAAARRSRFRAHPL